MIFNIVFFVVLTSVLVQGSTNPFVAHRLHVDDLLSVQSSPEFLELLQSHLVRRKKAQD
jgi:NhaP-type Na+/H+ and K+/H+ antiporter